VLRTSVFDEVLTYGIGQHGEPILLTLGGRRATMAAGVGGVARLNIDVDDGGLRGSSG
jgi:hypothetical protein